MRSSNRSIYILVGIMVLLILGSFVTEAMAQNPFFPFWGFNPYPYYFGFIPPVPPTLAYFPPVYAPNPVMAYPPLTRAGAATIIITNPTAGTVTVLNPTVAAPTVVTAAPSPPPLLSLLGTIYASALYEGALSTANPLLFALLQNLFL